MTTRSRLALLATLSAALLSVGLVGCAPGGSSDGGSSAGGDGGSGGGGGLNCDGVATGGYELFVDPRLEIEPELEVYPLGGSERYTLTDSGTEGNFTTYSYSLAYLDDGVAFRSGGGIFVGAEDTGSWTLEGPISPTGIDGGPYAGFMDIEATTSTSSTVIARLCVVLAE